MLLLMTFEEERTVILERAVDIAMREDKTGTEKLVKLRQVLFYNRQGIPRESGEENTRYSKCERIYV